MVPVLAAVQTWHVVVLTFVCIASLIVSLYCLFFMVPVKRFYERMRSLGGGIKGVESHMKGVMEKLQQRIEESEQKAQEAIQKQNNSLERRLNQESRSLHQEVEKLRNRTAQLQDEMARLRQKLGAQQDRLDNQASQNQELVRAMKSLGSRLRRLQDDFEGIDGELKESTRQFVSDSYQQLEAVVLAALDSIQDQMLRGAGEGNSPFRRGSGGRGPRGQREPRTGDAEGGGSRKIISAGSLFNAAGKSDEPAPEEEENDSEKDENSGEGEKKSENSDDNSPD